MAVSGTYYLNGPDLATSTAIFADEDMNVCAADGLYSDGLIVRELLNCVLLPAQPCPQCALPCGQVAGESSNINGTFLGQINAGADIGAVVVYSIVGNTIPDGILSTYNGQTFNRLTYIGNNQGPVGLNTPVGQPTYFGSPNNTPVSQSSLPVYTIQTDGTYLNTGTNAPINVVPSQIDLRGGGTRVYTHVIPKNSATATGLNIDFYGPILGTFFSFQADCPIPLDSFLGSPVQIDDTCANPTETYYFAQNATTTFTQPIVFVPETLSVPGVGNFVYTDANGGSPVNNTGTSEYIIVNNTTFLEIQYGIVIATGPCTDPPNACDSNISESSSGNGFYNADIDLGGTAGDVGAVVVYFHMGTSIPDGVLIEYDGDYYNILTSKNIGNAAPYGRVNNSGTFDPTYVGGNNSFSGSPYTGVTDYELVSGSYVNQGTTSTIDVQSFQNDTRGQDTFTMVIPKTSASPQILNLKIFAPINNTVFRWQMSCPEALPSFSSTGPQGDISCNTATETYYFARNAQYNSGTGGFTVDTNVRPQIGNFVFADEDGAILLNDTGVSEYYIMDNNDYIQVEYGIVVATGSCDPT